MAEGKRQQELMRWIQELKTDELTVETTQSVAHVLSMTSEETTEQAIDIHDDVESTDVDDLLAICFTDEMAVVQSYPTFDLAFLPSTQWAWDTVQDAIAAKSQWVFDQWQSLYVIIGQLLQTPDVEPLAVRSDESGTHLFHFTMAEVDHEDWGVEISAFIEDVETCQIEISLFPLSATDINLTNVPITLNLGDEWQREITDGDGVAIFSAIPRDRLAKMIIRVESVGNE